MALPKQIIPISFNQGIDTKTDPKQVLPGKLIKLENGIFKTAKEIRKRFGFDSIPNSILGGGSISNGVNASSYQDELTVLDGESLYSYSESTSDLLNKGTLPTTSITTTSVVRNNFRQIQPDSAINGNIQVFAWNDTQKDNPMDLGSIRYSVLDTETGQSIVNSKSVNSSPGQVKVMSIGDYVVIIYNEEAYGNNFYYRYINVTTPTTISSAQQIATDSYGSYFDACFSDDKLYISYVNSSNGISICYLDTSLVLSSFFTESIPSSSDLSALNIFPDSSGNIWCSFGKILSGDIDVFVVNGSLSSVILADTVVTTLSSQALNISGIVSGTTSTIFYSYGPINNATVSFSSFTNQTDYSTVTLAGVVGSQTVVARGISIVSKVFPYNENNYFLGVFSTLEQPTYFLINQNGEVISKFTPNLAGGVNPSILPEVNVLEDGSYQFSSLIKDLLISFAPTTGSRGGRVSSNYTQTGVQLLGIKFTSVARPKLTLGNNLHYGGGLLWMYDGVKPVEHNFNVYPEGISYESLTSGGAIGIGANPAGQSNQVQYSVIYEWTDNEGQLHRSGTSTPVTVKVLLLSKASSGNMTEGSDQITSVSINLSSLKVGQVIVSDYFVSGTYITDITGSTVTVSTLATDTVSNGAFLTHDVGSVTLHIPTLRISQKNNVQIVVYRTVCNGSIFYRVTPPDSPVYNDPTVDSITYTDTAADQNILSNEQLYTTGGEVDNQAAPAISALATYKNRALYLSPETPNAFGYSKQVIDGYPVEFSPLIFTQTVDSRGGRLTCISEMDDKIVLFKKNIIFYVAGDGPTPSGANNDFTNVQLITSDTGCENQASIVLCPIGLMFQSPKGIYLLGRNLQVQYIGAEVEAYNNQTVTSSQLITTLNQVRFTLDSGIALVYDYYFQQWSVFKNINAVDSTSFKNQFAYISPEGLIYQENPDIFTDAGSFVPLAITTSWFSFAGIQGFERIYKLLLVGDYKSPHTLNIDVGYDFSSETTQISPIHVLSNPGVYQYRVFWPRQKCEALQFSITETQESPFGEGLSLSAMSMEVGIKTGLNKMAAAKSYG